MTLTRSHRPHTPPRPGRLRRPLLKHVSTWLLALAAASTGAAHAFDLQGHRGARGLAPENTLAAFRTATRWPPSAPPWPSASTRWSWTCT
jgi:hypothetical protein